MAKYSLGGKSVSRAQYMKEMNRLAKSKGLRGSWRFITRGTPTQMKKTKLRVMKKNPLKQFRTAKDWKKGSRILEVKEWY